MSHDPRPAVPACVSELAQSATPVADGSLRWQEHTPARLWTGRVGVSYRTSTALDGLQHVVSQQTERELENRGLWSAADQTFEPEDFRDLLKHTFDAPAFAIQVQQLGGRELRRRE